MSQPDHLGTDATVEVPNAGLQTKPDTEPETEKATAPAANSTAGPTNEPQAEPGAEPQGAFPSDLEIGTDSSDVSYLFGLRESSLTPSRQASATMIPLWASHSGK
jgi:hypothetical protein